MDELTGLHWAILLLGSAIMGLSKGGIPGAGNLTVALYVLVLEDALGPAGVAISVGLLLPVLISADLASTIVYRKHVEWKHLRRLLPFFAVGVIAGWWAFDFFQPPERSRALKVLIGTILLSMTAMRILSQLSRVHSHFNSSRLTTLMGPLLGLLGGMATMLANAAGPIAQFYLLAMKLPKYAFIGTSAWLFLIVNISKVPLMYELDILDMEVFRTAVWLFFPAIFGALVAPRIVRYIRQDWFERMIWFFIVTAGLRMIM
ncbi:sulfite exporter TauE/SafE family protein [Opitutales bacterium]|nr:sulfite exporter TauE/SafE family protein [Opitutales bacterium]MDA8806635.1 sulfite exporter TauE/SafE family protein [Opitutales bacterium]